MDRKYKHFHQQRVFQAPRDLVIEAVRTLGSESLEWRALRVALLVTSSLENDLNNPRTPVCAIQS
jgi:hypothetical protein